MLNRSQTLYKSPNGDVWTAALNERGALVVVHQSNQASGGQRTETDVSTFLNVDHYGPEHEALLSLIGAK